VIEHHREYGDRLADRLAAAASCSQFADERSDLVRADLVDAAAEQRCCTADR
jgi:hypothetical protein